MQNTVLQVEGMSCGHCVRAVEQAVSGLAGVISVAVDLAAHTATVQHDPTACPVEKIREAIEDEGFEVVG